MPHVLLSYADLGARGIRYSRIQLRRKERAGTFPRRVVVSPQRVGWVNPKLTAGLRRSSPCGRPRDDWNARTLAK